LTIKRRNILRSQTRLCVKHVIRVDNLVFGEISGKFQTVMQPYFRGRYQNYTLVQFNAYDFVSSRLKSVINGVPQGLIVRSIFILVYFND
jgi:hypothetical protein